MFLRNKKTTVLGLSGLISAVVNFMVTKDVAAFATGAATSLGLLLAQDGGL